MALDLLHDAVKLVHDTRSRKITATANQWCCRLEVWIHWSSVKSFHSRVHESDVIPISTRCDGYVDFCKSHSRRRWHSPNQQTVNIDNNESKEWSWNDPRIISDYFFRLSLISLKSTISSGVGGASFGSSSLILLMILTIWKITNASRMKLIRMVIQITQEWQKRKGNQKNCLTQLLMILYHQKNQNTET